MVMAEQQFTYNPKSHDTGFSVATHLCFSPFSGAIQNEQQIKASTKLLLIQNELLESDQLMYSTVYRQILATGLLSEQGFTAIMKIIIVQESLSINQKSLVSNLS